MRISTNQIYQNGLSSLLAQQERVTNLQEQLATGLKVKYASDDPISFTQIDWMNQRISTTELLQKNCMNASNALNLEESVLSNCVSNLQRLRQIQVEAGDGSKSEIQRQALATEARDILTQIQAFANSKDNDGNYLFAGAQTGTMPFSLDATGQYIYNGDSTQRFQLIAPSLQIAINDVGDEIFMRIPDGNGDFSVSATAANQGTGTMTTGAVTDSSAYIADDYTVNFATNSAGQLVVMVSGAATGTVIPSSGIVDDAPLYQMGMSLSFNGLTVEVSGMPQAGDSFQIKPSENTSLFATIQDMVNNLNLPFTTAVEKAATVSENNQLMAQIDSALKNITNIISNLGSRSNQVVSAQESNQDMIDASTITLKYLSEAPPTTVATQFNLQLVSLEAAQLSFTRVQNLSIFKYI